MPRVYRVACALLLAGVATSPAIVELAAQESNYRVLNGWARLPTGVEAWGQTIGVDLDAEGNLWVFHRCYANNCRDRDDVPAVLKYSPAGHLLDSWGEGLFVWPHGFSVDADGNVWTSDAQGIENEKGHQVMKFSPAGELLMTLGRAGVAGEGPDVFSGPADVAIAPNGDIFVADGHGNNRVAKFSADGRFIKAWGEAGTGQGQFDEPHCLAFDSRGRLFVGDRRNQRIQVFDQDGNYLDEWTGIMASGMHITEDDVIYVADYQLRDGIVIANARDFSEIDFIADAHAEGVVVDDAGNIFVGEVLPRNLKKFAKN